MKHILIFLTSIIFSIAATAQTFTMLTWNIANFGMNDSAKMPDIAKVIKAYDIVCIQEVNNGDGKKGCEKLLYILNHTSPALKFDMRVSDPTTEKSHDVERYAYFWNTKKVKLAEEPKLAAVLEKEIAREPFLIRFKIKKKTILLATIHTLPTEKKPAKECTLLYRLDSAYSSDRIILCGDFNLSESSEEGFGTLKAKGYVPSITGRRTSLSQKVKENGECYANEYDNVFYKKSWFKKKKADIVDLTVNCTKLGEARKLSDHVPVFAKFTIVK